MLRVYIAAPMKGTGSKIDPNNIERAIQAGRTLLQHGLLPFIPHLNYYVDPNESFGMDVWMRYDLAWIRQCQALLRLPGRSTGADREQQYAQSIPIPVYHSIPSLLERVGNMAGL